MQLIHSATLLMCGAFLVGCQPSPPERAQESGDRCNASAVQKYVGERATPALLDQARHESGASVARVLRPGDVVTLEYNAQRLSLSTDEALEIQQVSCG